MLMVMIMLLIMVLNFLCHDADAAYHGAGFDHDVAEHGADADVDGGVCSNI